MIKESPMKVVRILFFVFLVPTLAFAQYKIVLKNGKVIEGKYLHEDQANIYVESNGIQMNFKKDRLDLDKMNELNTSVPAPVEVPAQKPSTPTVAAPKAPAKKAARVYTTEDLKQMKEIWDEGKEDTEPSPAEAAAPVAQSEVPQTASAAAEVPETASAAQTMPAESVAPVPASPEAQSQPAEAPVPVVPAEPSGPRDEKTIKDEIETTQMQIVATEKMIQDLRAKGRVTANWEKLVVKQKQRIVDLQQELKDSIAARKAAKTNS
jgi:hypothetical protein